MSRRELGGLRKWWKAVERKTGQGEYDIKSMQAKVESLRKKGDGTGWSAEQERASEEALRRAKDDAMGCTQVGVYPLLDRWIFWSTTSWLCRNGMWCVRGFLRFI